MKKVWTYNDPMFGGTVILHTGTYNQMAAYIKRKYKCGFEEQRYYGGAMWFIERHNHCAMIIWVPDMDRSYCKMSTLSHECLHAASWMLDQCNIKTDDVSKEVLAYLQQMYFNGLCDIAFDDWPIPER